MIGTFVSGLGIIDPIIVLTTTLMFSVAHSYDQCPTPYSSSPSFEYSPTSGNSFADVVTGFRMSS